ncbi:YoaK family protein [Sphingomonas bisphenolicum]|uniref:Membrane protein n=1 Tax=Sphingomonas bisphenolicum TaxID=296544 RepID=A0ABM7G5W9_9SPHN|nr:YoaK family protein [Sphingomonas bisphenolicum]BBF70012.1 membrane protein [Sphingomonas bisphenolicum]
MTAAKTTPSPLPWLLLLLSVTTGLVDAISVLGLGKVFTANMTGNIVFLGFAAAGTPGFRVAPYLAAIAAFMIGALAAGRVGKGHAGLPLRRWLLVAALVEAVLLWIAAGVAVGFDFAIQSPDYKIFAIIALTGVAMGFRNATIRQLKVPDLTTTVLTLTVTGLAADSSLAGGSNPNWGRRIGSVAAIFLGAAIGAFLVTHGGLVAPLLLAGMLVLAGTLACMLHPAAGDMVAG